MPTAAEHLATFGVSVGAAREWIFANLGSLLTILNVADAYGVTNAMLGEIVGGYSGEQVKGYFAANGIDSSVLDEPVMDPDPYDPYYEPYEYSIQVMLAGVAAADT